ncbi:Asp23/Gls24 family envelope stress response protein [Micromonospora sp. 15K316]|uniref:Asp23/Gls24 family envelope stress response protein n=1 Tax=Micromonospora sp. 15K316 TaxID=2530376 RepID=UPI00104C3D0D|nr:Asp23/Gls24 family envelope stress response protein [Micromonospora sp. 15K316]TDC26536.1 Asp23/Gls24 family envelope stress response protein [Micromonospora sp. 15K316]
MTDAVENAGGVQPAVDAARGATSVSDEVVEKIAGAAARSVPGVADLGGDVARFFNSVLDKVGMDEVGDARRGVSADVKGTSAVINVVLVIDSGQVVADVTKAVRAAVIEAVEKYGLTVTQVNVTVDDIELNQPGAAGA